MTDNKSQDRRLEDPGLIRDRQKQGKADPGKQRASKSLDKSRASGREKAAEDVVSDDRFQATDN